jgi:DNA-binding transcriptional LysR family regulator
VAQDTLARQAPLPNLTTLKLRVFREVVERQSLTAAAQALFVAQPVVSAHLRSLEQTFGTRLLLRQGRRMIPTQAGQDLFNYACVVLEATQRVVDQIGNYRSANRGKLSLGADRTAGTYAASALVMGFLQAHQEVEIALHIVDQTTMQNSTLNGVFDFGYTSNFDIPPGLEFEPLSQDQMILVVRPDHPWARRGTIALRELADEVFVAAEAGTPRRTWEDNWLALRGVRRRVRLSAGHIEVCKQGVLAGVGVALSSKSGLLQELANGTLAAVDIEDEPWPLIERGIVFRRGMHLTPLHQAFLLHCRASVGRAPATPTDTPPLAAPLQGTGRPQPDGSVARRRARVAARDWG